jgi:methylsterol monooxygenase
MNNIKTSIVACLSILILYFSTGFLFSLLDIYKPEFLYKYKIQTDTHVPLKNYKKIIIVCLMNIIFIIFPIVFITFNYILPWRQKFGYTYKYNIYTIIPFILVSIIITEFVAYVSHRLLHIQFLFDNVHKYHHEFISPIVLADLYAHPIEIVFWDVLPTFITLFIFCPNSYICIFYILFILFTSLCTHSGYFLMFNNGYHDLHHERMKCNYGPSGIFDMLFGTFIYREPNLHYPKFNQSVKTVDNSLNEFISD